MMGYALGEIDSKKKKMYFKKGLNRCLKVALSGHTCYTLRKMINKVLVMERDRLEANALYKEKKHRSESTSRAPASQRPCAQVWMRRWSRRLLPFYLKLFWMLYALSDSTKW